MCGPPWSGDPTAPMTHILLDSRRVASPASVRHSRGAGAERAVDGGGPIASWRRRKNH
jgi:hypothetical protein